MKKRLRGTFDNLTHSINNIYWCKHWLQKERVSGLVREILRALQCAVFEVEGVTI